MKNKALSALQMDDWTDAAVRPGDDGLWHWAMKTGDVVNGSIQYGSVTTKEEASRIISKPETNRLAETMLAQWLEGQPEWMKGAYHNDPEVNAIIKRCALGSCLENAINIVGQALWIRSEADRRELFDAFKRCPNQYRVIHGDGGTLIQPT